MSDKPDPIITDRKILRQISRETTLQEVQELNLISRLVASNKTAWAKGAGLSAIQIGIPIRFAWYIHDGKEGTLLNPVILEKFGLCTDKEACLSIRGKWLQVERAYEIVYLTNGKKKTARGFLARLIQHEIDHMNGILFDERQKA